jgi:FolB domain-containing protein
MPIQRLSQPYPFCLSINKLTLPVHVGITAEEREKPQMLLVDVKLYYPTTPDASRNDAADYHCYDSLCKHLLARAQARPVELIEFLVGELYRCLREHIPDEVKIHVAVHKPLPSSLVGYEVQGATAEYTDLDEGII